MLVFSAKWSFICPERTQQKQQQPKLYPVCIEQRRLTGVNSKVPYTVKEHSNAYTGMLCYCAWSKAVHTFPLHLACFLSPFQRLVALYKSMHFKTPLWRKKGICPFAFSALAHLCLKDHVMRFLFLSSHSSWCFPQPHHWATTFTWQSHTKKKKKDDGNFELHYGNMLQEGKMKALGAAVSQVQSPPFVGRKRAMFHGCFKSRWSQTPCFFFVCVCTCKLLVKLIR